MEHQNAGIKISGIKRYRNYSTYKSLKRHKVEANLRVLVVSDVFLLKVNVKVGQLVAQQLHAGFDEAQFGGDRLAKFQVARSTTASNS